jgi:hypothetical protein
MKRFVIASLIFLFFIVLILPKATAATEENLGEIRLPDTRFYYTQADLYQITEEIGQEGRSYYVRQRITFDLLWPIVYAWFLYTGLLLVFSFSTNPALTKGPLWLPILALVFDYLENGLTSTIMLLYPTRIDGIAKWVPMTTMLKWIFIALSFIALVGGLLYRFLSYSRRHEAEKWSKENQE